jgi:catalase
MSPPAPKPPLTGPAALARLALIGMIVLAVVAGFAAIAGLFSSHRLTQAKLIDTFQQIAGTHDGFRRNHAKGVCIAGYFDGNGAGAALSKSTVFQPGRVPVTGRFALAGSLPFMADGPKAVRSMALSFQLPDGEIWRTGMNDIPVFPVRNATEFYQLMLATAPDPGTGKPDPAKVKAFMAGHPGSARALQAIGGAPMSSGFADARYNSLDAFRFVDAGGHTTPVRWAMVPTDPVLPAGTLPADKNALFDAFAARLQRGPVTWHLVATIGMPGDATDDATTAWPATRSEIDLGTLTIDHIESEAPGNCRDVNFDPLVLPSGIEASDDPLLSARSAAYAQSFTRREGETKSPSAVQIPASGKGA